MSELHQKIVYSLPDLQKTTSVPAVDYFCFASGDFAVDTLEGGGGFLLFENNN